MQLRALATVLLVLASPVLGAPVSTETADYHVSATKETTESPHTSSAQTNAPTDVKAARPPIRRQGASDYLRNRAASIPKLNKLKSTAEMMKSYTQLGKSVPTEYVNDSDIKIRWDRAMMGLGPRRQFSAPAPESPTPLAK